MFIANKTAFNVKNVISNKMDTMYCSESRPRISNSTQCFINQILD